jgi:hypothetical protein
MNSQKGICSSIVYLFFIDLQFLADQTGSRSLDYRFDAQECELSLLDQRFDAQEGEFSSNTQFSLTYTF